MTSAIDIRVVGHRASMGGAELKQWRRLIAMRTSSGFQSRGLYKRLMEAVEQISPSHETVRVLTRLLQTLVDDHEIPIIGGRIWALDQDIYRLIDRFGGRRPVSPNYGIHREEPIIRKICADGACFITESSPGYNSKLERDLGVHEYGAIAFGEEKRFLLSLDVQTEHFNAPEEVLTFLFVLRYIANQRIAKDRFERILQEACDVQSGAIPQDAPTFLGYEVFGKSTLAHREKVGGDVFDFLLTPSGDLAVLVADSCGHGLSSAVMARDVRTAVHMGVLDEIDPPRLLSRVNRVVCDRSPADRFISVFLARINNSNLCVSVSAGHPGFLVRAESTQILRMGGVVFGVHKDASYRCERHVLEPGDLIAVYTDGLSEARTPALETYGEDRIQECLRRFRELPAREIVERTLAEVDKFTSGRQDDDQTMVVVKRSS